MLNFLTWDFWLSRVSRKDFNRVVRERETLRKERNTAVNERDNARLVNKDLGEENIRLNALVEDAANVIDERDDLYVQRDALQAAHQEVVEERNRGGALLLDCLTWMKTVNITTKQRGGSALIAEREALVERARGLEWLPGKTEEEQEEVEHA